MALPFYPEVPFLDFLSNAGPHGESLNHSCQHLQIPVTTHLPCLLLRLPSKIFFGHLISHCSFLFPSPRRVLVGKILQPQIRNRKPMVRNLTNVWALSVALLFFKFYWGIVDLHNVVLDVQQSE